MTRHRILELLRILLGCTLWAGSVLATGWLVGLIAVR